MEKETALVTIGMTVYNDEKYIRESIESLLSQTYGNFILFISDDCSTDNSAEICKEYSEKDSRIIFVKQYKNNGSLFNFKYVVDRARTPFFISCSGHDRYHPQFIEKLLPLVQKDDVVLAYPQTKEIRMDGSLGKVYKDDYSTIEIEKPADRYLYILNNLHVCNLFQGIWKTEIIKKIYLKPVVSNDILMLLHAALAGKFEQYKSVFFFRRTTREEKKDSMYKRQICNITGEYLPTPPRASFLKNQFIFENVKMLFGASPQLNLFLKLKLSTQTIYKWVERFYIKPSLYYIIRKLK